MTEELPVCPITTSGGVSVEFVMRTPHQRQWFGRYLGGKLHEPALTAYILDALEPGDHFVDVGSHLGWFAILAAMQGAKVTAFEMQLGLIPMIQESISHNRCDDLISLVPAGVGDRCGVIHYPRQTHAAAKGVAVDESVVSAAACLTLDAAIGDDRPSLVKIDVEGYEGHVLAGAKELLHRHRPSLVIEIHNETARYGESKADVLRSVSQADYELSLFDSHRNSDGILRPITPEDFESVRKDSLIVARPR